MKNLAVGSWHREMAGSYGKEVTGRWWWLCSAGFTAQFSVLWVPLLTNYQVNSKCPSAFGSYQGLHTHTYCATCTSSPTLLLPCRCWVCINFLITFHFCPLKRRGLAVWCIHAICGIMWGSSLPLTRCAVQLFWMPQSEAARDDAPWRFFAISAGFFSSFLLHLTVFNLKNCNCASISHLPRARHTHSHTVHTLTHNTHSTHYTTLGKPSQTNMCVGNT